ncbi:MAG: hypothetical protein EBR69_02140, partial [Synechococcaceae bacterium WB4_2_0805]|nr:hypothetical protein [Synechococcaceae bacterium WB4_2_0805]
RFFVSMGSAVAVSKATITCVCCGGSGVLRQGRDSYRTCLPCLGKGFQLANKLKASPAFAAR